MTRGIETTVPDELVDAELSPRQSRFVLAYLEHDCAARAAREAGYAESSCREIGSSLLTRPYVIRALRAAKRDLALSAGMTRHRLLRKWWRAARLGLGEIKGPSAKGMRKSLNLAAANRALELIAKMCGFIDERPEPAETPLTDAERLARLAEVIQRIREKQAQKAPALGEVIDQAPAE